LLNGQQLLRWRNTSSFCSAVSGLCSAQGQQSAALGTCRALGFVLGLWLAQAQQSAALCSVQGQQAFILAASSINQIHMFGQGHRSIKQKPNANMWLIG